MIVNRQSCDGGVGERAPGHVEPIGRTSVEHSESELVGCAESSITLFFATAAIAALKKLDVGAAMPAFFRLALTTVAVKILLPNFPHNPLAIASVNHEGAPISASKSTIDSRVIVPRLL